MYPSRHPLALAVGGDPDGDGQDEVLKLRDPDDSIVFYGDWDGNGTDTYGEYLGFERYVVLRNGTSQDPVDIRYQWGRRNDPPRRHLALGDATPDDPLSWKHTIIVTRIRVGRFLFMLPPPPKLWDGGLPPPHGGHQTYHTPAAEDR